MGINGIVSSSIDAATKNEALSMLASKGIRVISLEPQQSLSSRSSILSALNGLFGNKKQPKVQITTNVLLKFFEKLHKMTSCGLTLADAIGSINKRTGDASERELTRRLLDDISSGETLSNAIKNFGEKIDSSIYSMILIGESSGNLASVIGDVVVLLRSQNELKKKMISAVAYPSFIISLAFVVMLLFSFIIMPQMEAFIKDLGGEIPLLTRALKTTANGFVALSPIIAIIIVAAIIAIPKIRQTKIGRYKTDKILLQLPIASTILPLFMRTNLSNLLATLLGNGVNTSEALTLAETAINNKILLAQFMRAKTDILDGKSVCESFENHGIFDGEACDLLAVGEKVGDLASAFRDVHKMCDDNLKAGLKKMTLTISSAAMFFAFALIGLLAFGIVQSMMGATNAASMQ